MLNKYNFVTCKKKKACKSSLVKAVTSSVYYEGQLKILTISHNMTVLEIFWLLLIRLGSKSHNNEWEKMIYRKIGISKQYIIPGCTKCFNQTLAACQWYADTQ